MSRPRQLPLDLKPSPSWGGARKGAGRPPGKRPRIRHRVRPPTDPKHPVHLTLDILERRLRRVPVDRAVRRVLRELHERRSDFRCIAWSIQHGHLHLIVEADSPAALVSGIRALNIRLALRINAALRRKGRLFADTHHRRELRTPREVRAALAYVLLNRRRHLAQRYGKRPAPGIDEYSSGGWFTGWDRPVWRDPEPPAVVAAQTWVGRRGWKSHGLISPHEIPGRWRPPGAKLGRARERSARPLSPTA